MKKIFLIFLGLPVRAKICGVSYGRFGHEKAEIQLRNAESCEFQIHPEGNGNVKFRSVFNLYIKMLIFSDHSDVGDNPTQYKYVTKITVVTCYWSNFDVGDRLSLTVAS